MDRDVAAQQERSIISERKLDACTRVETHPGLQTIQEHRGDEPVFVAGKVLLLDDACENEVAAGGEASRRRRFHIVESRSPDLTVTVTYRVLPPNVCSDTGPAAAVFSPMVMNGATTKTCEV